MLPITTPFELDKESMILRNNNMYKHYNQLNLIQNRKNIYLPKIQLPKSPQNKKKIKINKNLVLFSIEKENEKLNNKINQINKRINNRELNERIFNVFLKKQKSTRANTRKIKYDLLIKTNNEIKNRIKNVHPIINHKTLKLQYLESRRIYHLNRKLKPCLSWGNNYFTKEDYCYMEKFGKKKNKSLNNSSSSSKDLIKLKKIKIKKLGFSMSPTKNKI